MNEPCKSGNMNQLKRVRGAFKIQQGSVPNTHLFDRVQIDGRNAR
jgi:hypothetical protein